MEYYDNMIRISKKLEKIYSEFWDNIKHNDAFIYHKDAIELYQGIFNKKNHHFHYIINKKLYTGNCQYIDKHMRGVFSENKLANLDDICNMTTLTINILDYVMLAAPKIPFDMEVFRIETRERTDEFFLLKEGQYYRSPSFVSTTLNPWLWNVQLFDSVPNKKNIFIRILLPKNSLGFYINNVFMPADQVYNDIKVGFPEWEILIMRGSIFKVIERIEQPNKLYITLKLEYQMNDIEFVWPYNTDVEPRILDKIDDTKYHLLEYKEQYVPFKKSILSKINKSSQKIKSDKRIDINNDLFNMSLRKLGNLNSPDIKTSQEVYINCKINYQLLFSIDNHSIKSRTVIKLSNSIVIDLELNEDYIIMASESYICTDDYMINNNYPYLSIIKLTGDIKYIPMGHKRGLACNIKKIKVDKVERITIYKSSYRYYIEAHIL